MEARPAPREARGPDARGEPGGEPRSRAAALRGTRVGARALPTSRPAFLLPSRCALTARNVYRGVTLKNVSPSTTCCWLGKTMAQTLRFTCL